MSRCDETRIPQSWISLNTCELNERIRKTNPISLDRFREPLQNVALKFSEITPHVHSPF